MKTNKLPLPTCLNLSKNLKVDEDPLADKRVWFSCFDAKELPFCCMLDPQPRIKLMFSLGHIHGVW